MTNAQKMHTHKNNDHESHMTILYRQQKPVTSVTHRADPHGDWSQPVTDQGDQSGYSISESSYKSPHKLGACFVDRWGRTSKQSMSDRASVASWCGARLLDWTISLFIGTDFEQRIAVLVAGGSRVDQRDGAALRSADQMAEPPKGKICCPAGGALSNGGQLRFGKCRIKETLRSGRRAAPEAE